MTKFSEDKFLGGRVSMRQLLTGFRSGLDAVMLAASIPAEPDSKLLELGCGAGAATLCVARREMGCSIVGVEIEPQLVKLANENARANGMHERVRCVEADVFSLPEEVRRSFDHVFANPPFHDSDGGEAPRDSARKRALHDRGNLGAWLDAGVKRAASNGTFTAIIRADRLGEALAALPTRGLSLFALWPRADTPAKRIILQLRKGSGAALSVLPGLVLHDEDGHYTKEADVVLRGGASLALGRPRL